MIRGNYGLWKAYLAPDFHPSQQPAALARPWLDANAAQYTVVARSA